MNIFKWCLQFLADGGDGGSAATGAGEGANAATGVNAGDAALPDRLAALGVPQAQIEKRRKALERREASMRRTSQRAPQSEAPAPEVAAQPSQPVAEASGEQAQEAQPAQPAATSQFTRESLLGNPEAKKIMDEYANEIVRNRVKSTGQEAENFRKLAPVIDTLAAYYGMDRQTLDLDEFAKRVVADDNYYEDRAIAEGRDVEDVRRDAVKAAQEQQIREQETRRQFDSLRQQGEALKQKYPNFDLSVELRNPAFARMVAPGSLISLEDAYYAVHRVDIQRAQQEAASKAAMEAASRSIQAGAARPVENGATPTSAQAAKPNYRDKNYRDQLKRRIYEAAARGEKVYPGQ